MQKHSSTGVLILCLLFACKSRQQAELTSLQKEKNAPFGRECNNPQLALDKLLQLKVRVAEAPANQDPVKVYHWSNLSAKYLADPVKREEYFRYFMDLDKTSETDFMGFGLYVASTPLLSSEFGNTLLEFVINPKCKYLQTELSRMHPKDTLVLGQLVHYSEVPGLLYAFKYPYGAMLIKHPHAILYDTVQISTPFAQTQSLSITEMSPVIKTKTWQEAAAYYGNYYRFVTNNNYHIFEPGKPLAAINSLYLQMKQL